MDEVLRGESFLAGCRISAHTAARVLVILLGMVLAGSPALREMTQDFLNAPIVPKATTEGSASVGGKQEGKVLKPDKAVMKDENEMIFRNPVPEDEVVLDAFLAEVSVPEMPLELPRLSEEGETYLAEIPVEMIPAVEDVVIPEVNVPENVLDTLPGSEGVLEETEAPGKVPDMIVTEKPAEDTVKAEVTVPEENPAASDPVIPVPPSDDLPVPEPIVPEPIIPDPVVPEPAVPEPVVPEPAVPEPVVPEPAVPEPVVPDPVVPEPGADVSDVTNDITSDAGEDNGAEETVSCFLLDDAGMLYGFLPEYAEIPDGCLTIPEECTGIRSGAFSGCGAAILELYIPAGATMIEEGAFAGLNFLEWIDVDPGNPVYTTDSGVLFDSTMSVLLAFPSAWTEGYAVPRSVTTIAGRAFENTSISLLDVRACGILSFAADAFGASAGNGIKIVASPADCQTYEEIMAGYGAEVTR